jgi:hypothetical protein
MFKLIGIAVVAFVIYVSWDTLSGLWRGDLSGKEAATVIRQDVGKVISEPLSGDSSSRNTDPSTPQKQSPAITPPGPRSAEQLADDLLKRK